MTGEPVSAGPADAMAPAVAPAPAAGPAPRPLATGAFAALSAQVVVVAAATLTSVAIARILGPSGTGAVALITNLIGIGTLLFGLGLRSGLVYELKSGRWGLRNAVRQSTVAAGALGLLGAAVVLALYAWTRGSVLKGMTGTTAIATAAALPFSIAVLYAGAIALARDRFLAYAATQAMPAIGTTVFAVALAIGFGLPGAAAGIAAGTACAALAAGVWLWRSIRREPAAGGASGSRLGSALRFGVQTWGGDVLQFLNYRLDLFILNTFAVIADVGVYSIAVTVTSLAWMLPNALTTVLFPRVAALEAGTRSGTVSRAEADATAVSGVRQTLILLIPSGLISVFLLVVAVPLLYGPRFAHATVLGLVLLPGVLIIGFGKAFSATVTGRGHPRYALFLSLISFPVTIVLYLVMIPPLAAMGAALATTISYVLTTAVAWVFFRRVTGLPARRLMPTVADFRDARQAVTGLVRAAVSARSR